MSWYAVLTTLTLTHTYVHSHISILTHKYTHTHVYTHMYTHRTGMPCPLSRFTHAPPLFSSTCAGTVGVIERAALV